ncbi:PAS domain-containing sensor histidine kinase [Flavobacteriales bacterium]|nr:PAS domain-containing sensor histidine kinase [Flavobacteriales bacterium]
MSDSNKNILQLKERAIESTSDGIALLDAEGKYYYLNEAHVTQFGYETSEELIGKTWQVFYKPVEIERLSNLVFPILAEEGTWRGETLGVKNNGETIYQEITLTALEDGGLICITRNLNQFKEVEEQLKVRNKQVTSVIKNVTSGILLEDSNRFVVEANEELGTMFNLQLNPDDLRGTDCRTGIHYVSHSTTNPDGFMESVDNLIKNGVPVYNELISLKNNAFLERDFIPIFIDNKLQSYLWVYRDITEHERSKQNLERLVEREHELNDMRSKLVRTISHEFKKPILNTLTSIQLLQDQFKETNENLYARGLDHIVTELEGLNKSVSKLVNYEALYDRSEAKFKPVNAKNLLRNYLYYHYKLFLLSDKFKIIDTCDEEIIQLNLELFNLALKNIVENALKYSSSNDVISVRTQLDADELSFIFSNPITIASKPDVKQLGNPLYRANPTDDNGLGLGLGIVKHVAEMHQCKLKYDVSDTEYSISLTFDLSK